MKRKKEINILVTGGTGFVGSYLIKKIMGKYKTRIFSRKNGEDLKNYGDIDKAVRGIDIVIHLAYSQNYPENVVMAENLIKACIKHRIKKIILLSSMSAKRKYPDDYGRNKLKIENMTIKSKLNYTILRPSIIYGKGSKSFDFIIQKMNKIPFFVPIIGTGYYKLAPVYVEDVVEAIERCIENKKTDRKDYDLPGGSLIYFVNLIDILKRNLGINKKNIYLPIFLCNIIAALFPGIISRENIINLTEHSLADISEAKKDFDYKPINFGGGLKNGLL